jgi:hypothetical protein
VLAAVKAPRDFLTAVIDERVAEVPRLEPLRAADVARHLDHICTFLKDLREGAPSGDYVGKFENGIAMAAMHLQRAIVGEPT